jgi:hypothetical protein
MMPNDPATQESVREQVYDPVVRWRDLLARIAWVEQNRVHRATPAACIRKQQLLWTAIPARKLPPPGSSGAAVDHR